MKSLLLLFLVVPFLAFSQTPVVSVSATQTTICQGTSTQLSASATVSSAPQTTTVLNQSSTNGAPIICDCPSGYVAVGFKARTGNILDQITLACKKLNPDGSLDPAVVYTNSVGGPGGGPRDPVLFNGNTALVGVNLLSSQFNGALTAAGFTGFGQPISSIVAGSSNTTASIALPTIQGVQSNTNAGTVYVPNGQVVTGIRVTSSDSDGLFVGSVALRYASINAFIPPTIFWNGGQSGPSITVSPNQNTVYTATATTASGTTASTSLTITVNALPTPMIEGLAPEFCQNGPAVTLNGNGSMGAFTVDGIKSTIFTPSSLSVGQHTVVYSVTNTSGCSASTSQLVTIKETPTAPLLLTTSGQAYPAGVSSLTVSQNTGTVSLSVSGCVGGTINWSGGSATTLAVSTASLGTQSFTATCTRNGCTSPTATATVSVGAASLKVLSRDPDNGQLNNNTLKPYLLLQNDGTTPISYSSITVRYYITTENNIPLIFQKNYVAIGQNNVNVRYVALATPRQGATGYIEYSFSAGAGSLAPGSSSGPIEIQVNKQNYSAFNQLDDYSYVNNGAFSLNPRITAYQNGVLFYGVEPGPAMGNLRQGPAEAGTGLQIRVLGNPVLGQTAEVEIVGAEGQAVQTSLTNLQGREMHRQSIHQAGALERVSVPLGDAQGIFFLQVNTPTQRQQVKLLNR